MNRPSSARTPFSAAATKFAGNGPLLIVCLLLAVALGAASVAATTLEGNRGGLVIVGLAFVALMLIVNAPRRVFLALAVLDIPLQFDTYLAHDELIGVLGTYSGFNISLTTIALTVLYGLWTWEVIGRKLDPARRHADPANTVPRIALAPIFAYGAVCVAAGLFGRDIALSIYELFIFGQLLLVYLYVIYHARSREDITFIITIMMLALVFESALMIAGRVIAREFSIAGLHLGVEPGDGGVRVGGTMRNPNIAASYLAMSVGLAIGVALSNTHIWLKRLAVFAAMLAVPAIVFTQSRGGWLSLSLSVLALVVLAYRARRISIAPIAAGAVVVAALLLIFQGQLMARLTADDNGSASARGPLNQIAIDMWLDHPFLGVGTNNFMNAIPPYLQPEYNRAWISTVHNRYLLILSESGPLGVITFYTFFATTLVLALRAVRAQDPLLSPLAMGAFSGLLGQLIHMAVDTYRWRSSLQLLMMTAGMIIVMHMLTQARAARDLRMVTRDPAHRLTRPARPTREAGTAS